MTTNKKDRKERPIARGVLDYFPDALAEVAYVSYVGNQQHNPGEEMHWAKHKSTDHADCLVRHLIDRGSVDTDGLLHSAKVAWRALALLQIEIEEDQKIIGGEIAAHDTMNEIFGEGYMESHGHKLPAPVEQESTSVDPHKPCKRIYIAGPMRGLPDFNFPEFDKAKRKWEEMGWTVISPADIDRMMGHTDNRGYAKRDTKAILECDAIFMLKGWQKSQGARAEHALAEWADLRIFYEEIGK